jgi:ribosomal-protein-alanine N-acetyltransferase
LNGDGEEMPEPEITKIDRLDVHPSNRWAIQKATLGNLDELVNLEKACFTMPWSSKSFEAELAGNQFSHVLIILDPGQGQNIQAVAYLCMWIIFEEIRFLNVAVHPDFRRQGLAKELISHALDLGKEASCCRGMLEVRETNHEARNLYESFQFQAYATRKSYYTNPTEDAILMTLEPLAIPDNERGEGRGKSVGSQTTIHTHS